MAPIKISFTIRRRCCSWQHQLQPTLLQPQQTVLLQDLSQKQQITCMKSQTPQEKKIKNKNKNN
jgi:hypothetical protein